MRDNAEKRAQKIMEAAWIESGSIVRIMYTTRKLDKRQTLARKRIYYLTLPAFSRFPSSNKTVVAYQKHAIRLITTVVDIVKLTQ